MYHTGKYTDSRQPYESRITMNIPILGNITAEEFLRDYWQKKPLLIRQAIPDFVSPIDGDELAGLSLESEVESRSEEHTSELQSRPHLVCRLLLEKNKMQLIPRLVHD